MERNGKPEGSISVRTVPWASKFGLKIGNQSLPVVRTSQSCGCGARGHSPPGRRAPANPCSSWGTGTLFWEERRGSLHSLSVAVTPDSGLDWKLSPGLEEEPALCGMRSCRARAAPARAEPLPSCCSCPSAAPQGAPDANPSSHKTNCVRKEHMVNKP